MTTEVRTRTITYARAKTEAMLEEMRRDARVFLLGEDIRYNPYKVTDPVADEFGPVRVRNTPISEAGFVGAAIGAALNGLRPIVDVSNSGFMLVAWEQLVNEAANLPYKLGGQARVPLTIRCTTGAGRSAGAQHSHSIYSLLMNVPGLKVALPATPHDMKGLLKTAIRDDNPVVVFEATALGGARGPVPEAEYLVPFGVAAVRRPGRGVTLVALSAMLPKAIAAAELLAGEGIDVELIDPRTIAPLDAETILASVAKTGRLVIVDEGHQPASVASEIAATVVEHGFDLLKAPVKRVNTLHAPIPFSPPLEQHVMPDEQKIVDAVRSICR